MSFKAFVQCSTHDGIKYCFSTSMGIHVLSLLILAASIFTTTTTKMNSTEPDIVKTSMDFISFMNKEHAIEPVPATSPNSTEIPGPSVLFWMVCFAINAMTQPSGRVCGLRYEPQWLLRSSPVLSAFDAADMLVATLTEACASPRQPFRSAVTRALLERFTSGEDGFY
ncbi:Uu.00g022350.m01.CDS01 [Anthostomella pinea]|uniref:Uu.00g022350.m01.CDS01 n=1 Tax=Anthostomella pinea TaxID=933095 RepID=A0AAI8VZU8_9PEZI|nr:Uu.00g022350.m01.CDS01 [Anthostomella pinea]